MAAYVVRRLTYGAVTLLALSLVVFFLIQAGGSPLDRLKMNPRMAPLVPQLTEYFGLDKPLIEQYLTWLRNFVTLERFAVEGVAPIVALGIAATLTLAIVRFPVGLVARRHLRVWSLVALWVGTIWFMKGRIDFALGWSQSFRGDGPVWDLIMGAAGATFRLGFSALLLSLLIGIPLGIYQAIRQYSFFDQLGTAASFVSFSMPVFILGVGTQLFLALYLAEWTGLKVFYVAGMTGTGYADLGSRLTLGFIDIPSLQQFGDIFQHLALPTLTIGLISLAGFSRFQRASMLEVMHSDYLRTAKAKGLPRRRIILKHGLRNALIPIVTLVSLSIANIAGGAIITESIFGWPGIGRVYLGAINAVDYPVVMAIVMAIGVGIVVMNIVADVLYGVLDPRVRYD